MSRKPNATGKPAAKVERERRLAEALRANLKRRKAAERGLPATFLVQDAVTLKDWSERFDNVIDSGLFHVFSDEDRTKYVSGLATVLKSGGMSGLKKANS